MADKKKPAVKKDTGPLPAIRRAVAQSRKKK